MAEGSFRPSGDRLAGYLTTSGSGVAYVQKVALVDDSGAADSSSTAIGNTDDSAWDGVAADATVISLLKAIAINTTPAA